MSQAISHAFRKLGTKLVLIATTFLLVALAAIGLTLLVSWNLEGGAAAVNQAGKERMRAYRIAMLLTQAELSDAGRVQTYEAVDAEVAAFEQTLDALKAGEPSRPMFLPGGSSIRQQFAALEQTWYAEMKPTVIALTASDEPRGRVSALITYRRATERYVDSIDKLVFAVAFVANGADWPVCRWHCGLDLPDVPARDPSGESYGGRHAKHGRR